MNSLGMSYQDIIDMIDSKVNEKFKSINKNQIVVYSAYDYDEWDNPIENLKEIPVKGKVKFVNKDGDFESEVLNSPTWLDITVIANEMLEESKDYQYRHFKDVDVFKNVDGIMTALLIMDC